MCAVRAHKSSHRYACCILVIFSSQAQRNARARQRARGGLARQRAALAQLCAAIAEKEGNARKAEAVEAEDVGGGKPDNPSLAQAYRPVAGSPRNTLIAQHCNESAAFAQLYIRPGFLIVVAQCAPRSRDN